MCANGEALADYGILEGLFISAMNMKMYLLKTYSLPKGIFKVILKLYNNLNKI